MKTWWEVTYLALRAFIVACRPFSVWNAMRWSTFFRTTARHPEHVHMYSYHTGHPPLPLLFWATGTKMGTGSEGADTEHACEFKRKYVRA